MLHWSIALVLIPSLVLILAMSRRVQRVLTAVARQLYRQLHCFAARLSAALDIVLRPRVYDGRSRWSRLALWLLINIAAIASVYHLRAVNHEIVAVVAAALLTGIHITVTAATILLIAEDNRIMHLGQPREGALFSRHAAVRDLTVIALETVLTIATSSALLDMLSSAYPGAILVKTPDTGSTLADHLLCLLAALPATNALVSTTDLAPHIAYGGKYGALARGTIYVMGSSLLYGAAAAWVLQRGATAMVLTQLEEADSDDAHFLQLILSRAPQHIKVDLLAMAIDSAKPLAQLRAINVMRHLKVWTFPQTFLHNLDGFERKVRIGGLNQIREFLAEDGMAFEEELLLTGSRKAFDRWARLAPTIANPAEDAVLSRLGGLITDYVSLIEARQIGFKMSAEQYNAMLSIAKEHKDDEVRRVMAALLMARGAKGFLMNYLVNMHERALGTIDTEIIHGFATYIAANPNSLSPKECMIAGKRLNRSLRCAGLDGAVARALLRLQAALGPAVARSSQNNSTLLKQPLRLSLAPLNRSAGK